MERMAPRRIGRTSYSDNTGTASHTEQATPGDVASATVCGPSSESADTRALLGTCKSVQANQRHCIITQCL